MVKAQPTEIIGNAFIAAYNHFNAELFSNTLKPCIIHMHRKAKCYGYFAGDRFGTKDGATKTDEIALNPSSFAQRSVEEVLSTLVHEMVHLWQHHHGKQRKPGYHDIQWAEKMEFVGLIPSTTGKPGGKMTGQSVSHYIEPEGPYAVSVARLIAGGFELPYIELWNTDKKKAKAKAASKTKYTCSGCGINAWAKHGLSINCNECNLPLEEA